MKKSAFITALSMGVLSISLAMATPQQAVSQVRVNATEVLTILNQANGSNNNQVRRQAENYAIPYFDFERLTALAVGNPWRNATPAQQKALTNEFKTLLIRTYSGTMLKFKQAKVVVRDNPVVKGRDVTVRAEVTPAGAQQPVMMDYTMRQSGNRYRVINVLVEGQSLVSTYRNQFGQTIARSGIDGLIADLKTRNAR